MKKLQLLFVIGSCMVGCIVNAANVVPPGKPTLVTPQSASPDAANAKAAEKKLLKSERRQGDKPATQPAAVIISN